MKIGEALSVLRKGGCVARNGWAGKGLFIFRQVPAQIDVETIVPKMQSLPQAVKDVFLKRFENSNNPAHKGIYYDNQLAIVDKDNLIQGWTPSVSDTLASDWFVVHQPVE